MLSLAQAMRTRGRTGTPLPTVFPALANAGADICRGQLTLIVGPPSAGKSLLAMNLLAAWRMPTLAFLLDTNELTASARFASILSGDSYREVKARIILGEGSYDSLLQANLDLVQACFYAPGPADVQLQMDAFDQRYGIAPDVVLIDNMGNQTSSFADEWATLKALTNDLDQMARREQSAIIACHHTTDMAIDQPAERTKMLGKVSQYARVILSVGFNDQTGEYKIAVVKNTEGRTDAKAERPITLWADPDRMKISEYPKAPSPEPGTEKFIPYWGR